MRTRMKRLISIGTIPVFVVALLLALGTVLADGPAIKPAPSLDCTITYVWMPGWEGTISGDIDGYAIWPSGPDPMRFAGQTSHYTGSFEIWSDDPASNPEAVLLLTGTGAGSTTVRHGRDSIWRTNGIVTGASDEFVDWIGRHVYQAGHFTWLAPGIPDCGEGTFRVN